jgi:uncharacterized protein (DUF1499 family)
MSDGVTEKMEITIGEPTKRSRTATAAAGLGIAGPCVTLAGILLCQLGAPPMSGFGLFQLGILSGLAALVTGGVALFLTRSGVEGRSRAWTGVGLGLLMVAIVALSARPGVGVPPINDITTDLSDPPGYAAVTPSHRNHGRDMSYPPEFVAQAKAAYPDLAPIRMDVGPDRAYRLAVGAAKDLGWEITRADSTERAFEAEDSTRLFRFVDDVSVRVRARSEGGAVIDVRSKSRDGRGDLGANAARIRRFAELAKAGGAKK